MSTSRVPWKRVIAEFLAIFAGVTLSLFAEDWRQGREDRQREAEFLAEISQDLARDSTELGSLLAQMESWDAASLWVNRNARQSSMPRDSVFRYLRRFGIISFYQPVRSGYVSIRDAGLLHLLNDGDVRRGIVDYYEVRQPYIEQFFALVFDGWNRWYRISAPHIDWVAPEDRESMCPRMDWASLIGGNTAGRIRQVLDGNAALRKSISAYMDPPEPLAGSRDTGEES